jgi:hypothetical protein
LGHQGIIVKQIIENVLTSFRLRAYSLRMKKKQTFFISAEAIEALKNHKKATGRNKSLLVERAILRCYGGKS